MSFGEKIVNYRDSILRDTDELMRIRSVSANDRQAASQALELLLQKARAMGFQTKNIDGIAGHVEYGQGEELAAILAHVDVVPAGDGWSIEEPYSLTEKNGRLYGRGIVDDKGPAVVALYCLKALKDNGITPKRRIRLIIGAAEEIGMNDMETYFREEQMPDMAFTPDSEYGICNCEKGILHIELSSQTNDSTALKEFHAGTAVNAVPAKASAIVNDSPVHAVGKAAHASTPEAGINAASHLIRSIAKDFGTDSLNALCRFLDSAVGLETDGHSLGISCSDTQSGALTVNLGKIDVDTKQSHAFLDIRYPVTTDFTRIIKIIGQKAAPYSLKVGVAGHEPPLSVSSDAPVIAILQSAYKTVTGHEAKLYSTGGGTYARTLKNNGVAFGPAFSGDETHIHDADESIDKEKFFTHAQICLEAVYGFAVK